MKEEYESKLRKAKAESNVALRKERAKAEVVQSRVTQLESMIDSIQSRPIPERAQCEDIAIQTTPDSCSDGDIKKCSIGANVRKFCSNGSPRERFMWLDVEHSMCVECSRSHY